MPAAATIAATARLSLSHRGKGLAPSVSTMTATQATLDAPASAMSTNSRARSTYARAKRTASEVAAARTPNSVGWLTTATMWMPSMPSATANAWSATEPRSSEGRTMNRHQIAKTANVIARQRGPPGIERDGADELDDREAEHDRCQPAQEEGQLAALPGRVEHEAWIGDRAEQAHQRHDGAVTVVAPSTECTGPDGPGGRGKRASQAGGAVPDGRAVWHGLRSTPIFSISTVTVSPSVAGTPAASARPPRRAGVPVMITVPWRERHAAPR